METDVTQAGDTSHSPTHCGTVSHAWKLMFPAQVAAVGARQAVDLCPINGK
jgi:hypothetical protein